MPSLTLGTAAPGGWCGPGTVVSGSRQDLDLTLISNLGEAEQHAQGRSAIPPEPGRIQTRALGWRASQGIKPK